MKLHDVVIKCKSRTDVFNLYCIGDIHLGARNCHETGLRKVLELIKNDPNALVLLGGDLCDCVTPQDIKRFDPSELPDWMFDGSADEIRLNLKDILSTQRKRLINYLTPIKDKIIGSICGNHEETIAHYHGRDFHGKLCADLGITDLTDCALIRINFKRDKAGKVITIFIAHGNGGGRSIGSEPSHLFNLASNWNVDLLYRGHSHTYNILPPIVQGYLPASGALPKEVCQKTKRCANWGTYLKSYASGASTYVSRACYPMRPLSTIVTHITPHKDGNTDSICIQELPL